MDPLDVSAANAPPPPFLVPADAQQPLSRQAGEPIGANEEQLLQEPGDDERSRAAGRAPGGFLWDAAPVGGCFG